MDSHTSGRISLGVMYIAHSLILKYFVFTLPGTAQFFASLSLPAALYPVFLIAASVVLALLGDGRYALRNVLSARKLLQPSLSTS